MSVLVLRPDGEASRFVGMSREDVRDCVRQCDGMWSYEGNGELCFEMGEPGEPPRQRIVVMSDGVGEYLMGSTVMDPRGFKRRVLRKTCWEEDGSVGGSVLVVCGEELRAPASLTHKGSVVERVVSEWSEDGVLPEVAGCHWASMSGWDPDAGVFMETGRS